MKSLFAFLISLTLLLSAGFAQAETYGTMMVVKGDIKVASAKSGKVENAKVGFKVYEGDAITAGADSRAKIIMSDKNVLNISPDSKITIAKYENNSQKGSRNVELKVDYGKVRASVEQQYDGEKNKFNIRTPTAVAGVRGTDFLAGFNPQTRKTQVVTFSGVVAVGQAGANGQISNPVFVQPGQTTSVSEGQAPEAPKALPKEQVQDMNNESKAETAKNNTPEAQPAAQQAQKDEPKKEDAPKAEAASTGSGPEAGSKDTANNKQDSSSAAPAQNTAASSDTTKSPSKTADSKSERSPSSVPASNGSSGMISKGDLDTGSIAKDIKVVETPKAPVIIKAPVQAPTPTQNNAITEIIQNKNSKVKIEFCLPGRC